MKASTDEDTFNEAFIINHYVVRLPLVASIETAAAMLRGNAGKHLIDRSVERALHFP
ncbi:hypothetical protein ACNKHS_01250 [Shigella flexneri]